MNQRTSQAGSSSRQCLTTLYGLQKEIANYVKIIQRQFEKYAERFPRGHWSFLEPGSEKKWYGTYDGKPDGSWTRTAEKMLQNFKDSSRPIFRCSSPLERGQLRSKGGGKTTIPLSSEVRKILSCSSRWSSLSTSSVFTEQWRICLQNCQLIREPRRNKKFLHDVLSQNCKPMKSDRETYCKNMRNDLRDCQKTRRYPDYAPKQV